MYQSVGRHRKGFADYLHATNFTSDPRRFSSRNTKPNRPRYFKCNIEKINKIPLEDLSDPGLVNPDSSASRQSEWLDASPSPLVVEICSREFSMRYPYR